MQSCEELTTTGFTTSNVPNAIVSCLVQECDWNVPSPFEYGLTDADSTWSATPTALALPAQNFNHRQQNVTSFNYGIHRETDSGSGFMPPPSLKTWVTPDKEEKEIHDPSHNLSISRSAQVMPSSQTRDNDRRSAPRRARSSNILRQRLFLSCCRREAIEGVSMIAQKGPSDSTKYTNVGNALANDFESLDGTWASRKTCFFSIGPLDIEPDRSANSGESSQTSSGHLPSVELICDKVFGSGPAESSTRYILPGKKSAPSRGSIFATTSVGCHFMLSSFAYKTVVEFNGLWKVQSGGKEVHQALAAMKTKGRIHKISGSGVRYLLIDSSPSLFRTVAWTSTQRRKEQRPWNGEAVNIKKAYCNKPRKTLTVTLSGTKIVAQTCWVNEVQTKLIEEYTLSSDFRRLKVLVTIEKLRGEAPEYPLSPRQTATRTSMVHT